jgi:hypothetical protein
MNLTAACMSLGAAALTTSPKEELLMLPFTEAGP